MKRKVKTYIVKLVTTRKTGVIAATLLVKGKQNAHLEANNLLDIFGEYGDDVSVEECLIVSPEEIGTVKRVTKEDGPESLFAKMMSFLSPFHF